MADKISGEEYKDGHDGEKDHHINWKKAALIGCIPLIVMLSSFFGVTRLIGEESYNDVVLMVQERFGLLSYGDADTCYVLYDVIGIRSVQYLFEKVDEIFCSDRIQLGFLLQIFEDLSVCYLPQVVGGRGVDEYEEVFLAEPAVGCFASGLGEYYLSAVTQILDFVSSVGQIYQGLCELFPGSIFYGDFLQVYGVVVYVSDFCHCYLRLVEMMPLSRSVRL